MKELRSEIEITASAKRVWEILTDFAGFPNGIRSFARHVETL